MNNKQNTMAARIAGRRQALELTQQVLATRLGVTAHAVTQWESGARTPRTVDMLVTLADVLDCSVDFLCTGKVRMR